MHIHVGLSQSQTCDQQSVKSCLWDKQDFLSQTGVADEEGSGFAIFKLAEGEAREYCRYFTRATPRFLSTIQWDNP